MQQLLGKCHCLVGHFKHFALATDGLIKKKRPLDSRSHFVLYRKWQLDGTVFYMLQRLMQLEQPIHLYLKDAKTKEEGNYTITQSTSSQQQRIF